MGLLGVDANSVSQKTYNTQTASQEGPAFGSVIGKGIGAGGTGNIAGGVKVSKGGVVNFVDAGSVAAGRDVAIQSLAANHSLAIATIEGNQALSSLAITSANTTSSNALETLRNLNSQHNVAEAGGTGAEVAGVAAGETTKQKSSSLATVGWLFGVTGLLYFATKNIKGT